MDTPPPPPDEEPAVPRQDPDAEEPSTPRPAPRSVVDVLAACYGINLTPAELPVFWRQLADLVRAGGETGEDPAARAMARTAAGVLSELACLAVPRPVAAPTPPASTPPRGLRALASRRALPAASDVPSKQEPVDPAAPPVVLQRRAGVPAGIATGSPIYLRVARSLASEAARVASEAPAPQPDPPGRGEAP